MKFIPWICGAVFLALAAQLSGATPIKVGSKSFAEGVIMGDLASQAMHLKGIETIHKSGLGGTQVVWRALLGGEIDVYPEYTGTLFQDQFHDRSLKDLDALRAALKDLGVGMSEPVGFSNSYALGMRRHVAEALKIKTISDLKSHPALKLGFSQEFATRTDGWPKLSRSYQLPQKNMVSMEHELAYRAIASDAIAITDLYTTDAEINMYDLVSLEDDQTFFPKYEAIFLYRLDAVQQAPAIVEALNLLAGRVSNDQMIAMNVQAKVDKTPEAQVASDYLIGLGLKTTEQPVQGKAPGWIARVKIWGSERFLPDLKNHLILVLLPLVFNILVGIPLGVIAYKNPNFGEGLLAATGILQTIPSLALLVFMIPILGIGYPPALCALFLYGLLPIVRNTFTALKNLSPALMESALALGLPKRQRLLWIELPLASPQIFAGIKISAVLNVGTATLGAIIGAGGFGEPIMIGIRRDDMNLVLQGAIPAAVLAILIQGLFEIAERFVVPRGLIAKR